MKRGLIIVATVWILLLGECRTAFDVSESVAETYQTDIEATVRVSTLTGVPCDYRLHCVTNTTETATEILEPASVAGIKAIIESDTCRIEYEEILLDSMMLPVPGMTPADCFDQTIRGIRKEIPQRYSYEKRNEIECLCLTFSQEVAGYQATRVVWLDAKSLELLEGEYYLNHVMVMRMKVESFAFTNTSAVE